MGLSVRVFGNIKITEDEEMANFQAYVIDDQWKHKIKNLKDRANYIGDVIFKGISYPYSCHSRFRESLIMLIGREDLLDEKGHIKWDELPNSIPFYDFIHFADNEGCLDWEVSETIYTDFEYFNERAKNYMDHREYQHYETWMGTFNSAKNNNGVVVFS